MGINLIYPNQIFLKHRADAHRLASQHWLSNRENGGMMFKGPFTLGVEVNVCVKLWHSVYGDVDVDTENGCGTCSPHLCFVTIASIIFENAHANIDAFTWQHSCSRHSAGEASVHNEELLISWEALQGFAILFSLGK